MRASFEWPVAIACVGACAGGTVLWRTRGLRYVSVVVKATFALVADGDMVLVAPAPIAHDEAHHDDHPARSIRRAAETAPYLARADVLLTGHAHAPAGTTVRATTVRLAVYGDRVLLDKALHVYGDRRGGRPEPFASAPLIYELAFGAPGHPDNPLGVGARPADAAGPPPHRIEARDDARRAAGFGPISKVWPARRRLLSDDDRSALREPSPALRDDFDFGYFQAAPPDQWIDYLRGDEWVLVENAHPAHPRLASRLPSVRAEALAFGLSPGEPHAERPVRMHADTLAIDADAGRATLLFRAAIPLVDEVRLDALRFVAGVAVGGAPIAWPDTPPAPVGVSEAHAIAERAPALDGTIAMSTRSGAVAAARPATPFRIDAGAPLDRTAAAAPDQLARASRALPFAEARVEPARPSSGPLPGAPWSTPATPVAAPPADLGRTLSLDVEPVAPAPRSPWAVAPPPSDAPFDEPFDEPTHVPPPPRPSVARPDAAALEADAHAEIVLPRAADGVPVIGAGPLTVFTVAWRGAAPMRTVVVKATLDLVADGAAALRAEADPPSGDVHAGDDPRRTLLYPSDFALFKPRADVVLVGHAHAPGGTSDAALVALRFGRGARAIDRQIAVFGDRLWEQAVVTLGSTAPRPFEALPLVHELAFGGPGVAANPVGRGAARRADGRVPLPNLEDPARLVTSPDDAPPPACFAGIPMLWRARWSKLGTYDARWRDQRWPYFPDDFDFAFFQAAPPQQQIDHLAGDEPFELVGMRREHPRLRGRLPGIAPRCFAQRTSAAGGAFEEVGLALDTVAFDVDGMKLTLVWRGLIGVADDDAVDLADLFVLPTGGRGVSLDEACARARAARAPRTPVATPAGASESANDGPAGPPARDEALEAKLAAGGVADASPPAPERGAPPGPAPSPAAAAVQAALARGEPLDGADLADADLAGIDLAGRSLARANLSRARLAGSRLEGARLAGAVLAGADLEGAALGGADLTGADLTSARLERASLAGARVDRAVFGGAAATGADLSATKGDRASFEGAALDGASFVGAALSNADFTGASLAATRFDRAELPAVRLYGARADGASFEGARLDGARADGASLRGASLVDASSNGSVWDRACLEGARMARARCVGAGFAKADLRRATLAEADLTDARLGRATLAGASLLRTNLLRASLEAADLTDADLRGANLHSAETWKAKLEGARLDLAIVTQSKLGGPR